MEQTILTRLVEIIVYSTAIFLVVWLFRTAFSKWLSPTLKYALWFLVLLRLCVPVTLESGVHLYTLPERAASTVTAEPVSTAAPVQTQPHAAAPLLDGGTNRPAQDGGASSPEAARNILSSLSGRQWILLVWATGFLVMLGVGAGLMIQLNLRIRKLGCEPGERTQPPRQHRKVVEVDVPAVASVFECVPYRCAPNVSDSGAIDPRRGHGDTSALM